MSSKRTFVKKMNSPIANTVADIFSETSGKAPVQPVKKSAENQSFDPNALARISQSVAAQNMQSRELPSPPVELVIKCGGGVLGYLKALRQMQRGES